MQCLTLPSPLPEVIICNISVVYQVARQLQPSVVYVGDAERTFVKKVPKTDKVIRIPYV